MLIERDCRGLNLVFFASEIAPRDTIDREAHRLVELLAEHLEDNGFDQSTESSRAGFGKALPALTVPVVLTGGTEHEVLRWLEAQGPEVLALLLAVPHSNSLPASLEILARLGQQGRRGRVILLDREGWQQELTAAVAALRAHARLRAARIGLIGGPSSWLAASSPTAELVRESWGPEVIEIPLDDLIGAAGETTERETNALVEELKEAAAAIQEPAEETLSGAMALHSALKRLVWDHSLDAVSVRCFDLLGPLNNTGCLALARHNDDGIVAGCEGDLPATLTMLLARYLTGLPSFMANPSDMMINDGLVTFAHCTVPLSIVDRFSVRSHFESGTGAGVAGRFREGDFTVLRIGGKGLERVVVFTGTAVGAGDRLREDLCRTQVTLDIGKSAAARLLQRPLGNHHILVSGDHQARVEAYALLRDGINYENWRP